MRDIEFRIKLKSQEKPVFYRLIEDIFDDEFGFTREWINDIESIDQFVNVHDRYGNKIFENDIIKGRVLKPFGQSFWIQGPVIFNPLVGGYLIGEKATFYTYEEIQSFTLEIIKG